MKSSGWAKIVKAGVSTAQWFIQQISYRKKVSKCLIQYPYGFHANAKANESIVFWMGVNGDPSNKIGFAWNPNVRPDLLEGEVAVYQPGTNTLVKFLVDGTVQLDSDVAVNVTSPEATIDGNVTITGNLQVDGIATLGSGGALIARQGDATTVTIPGGSSAGTYAGSITGGSPGGHTAS